MLPPAATEQFRHEAGANERRFAAPGGANDSDKPVFPKARGQLRGLLVPTEKEVVVAKLKGAQAGEWIFDFVV